MVESMKESKANESRKRLAVVLEKHSKKSNEKIWKVIAGEIMKAKRKKTGINLWRINRIAKKGSGMTMVTPSKVLGFGEIEKAVSIVAPAYSEGAKKKIEEAGGRLIGIEEFIKSRKTDEQIVLVK
jgi:large subunit ribosomal protein L18e